MGFKRFIKQCHEHNLFKMLSIYIVSSWVLLQVLSITWQPLGLPQKSVTFLIILLLVLLPFYLLIIWKFKMLQFVKENALEEGEETDADSSEQVEESPLNGHFKRYYLMVSIGITAVCAFASFFIIRKNFIYSEDPKVVYSETNRIAVLKFGNNTGNPKYDDVGKMASDWILHGITENNLGQVISPDVIDQYNTVFGTNTNPKADGEVIKEYLKPARIVTGNYFLKNGKFVFQATLIDGKSDKTIYSFKSVDCPESNPLACIEDLEETINGFFVTEGRKKLMLQESPPNFEAYQMVLQSNYIDYDENYLRTLEKAIELDKNYFEPKILRVAYHYNMDNFVQADSLLRLLKPISNGNARQSNLIKMYDALLKGDNKKVYQTNLNEYKTAPFDITSNATTMTIAFQFVNMVEKVDEIYNQIENDQTNLATCYGCMNRIYIKSLADIQLKKYAETIKLLKKATAESTSDLLRKPYVTALIRNGDDDLVKAYLLKLELTENEEVYAGYALYSALEYLLKNDEKKAERYFKEVLKTNAAVSRENAFAYLHMGNYSDAQKEFTAHIQENPSDFQAYSALAISHYKNKDEASAKIVLDNMDKLRKPFQFGEIDYSLAQYYAVTGDTNRVNHYLLKAVASGKRFTLHSYANDVFFRDYVDTKKFKEVMQFWH